MITNKFDVKTALQILYYLQSGAKNNKEKFYYLFILKLFFFADRYHLRNYGLPIFLSHYEAMKYGPVSKELDLMLINTEKTKSNFKSCQFSSDDILLIDNNINKSEAYKAIINKQNDDLLSKSIKEALDFSIDKFSHIGRFELANISHDYPEWDKVSENEIMNYLDFFDDININETNYLKRRFKEDPFKMDEECLKFNKNQFILFANSNADF